MKKLMITAFMLAFIASAAVIVLGITSAVSEEYRQYPMHLGMPLADTGE